MNQKLMKLRKYLCHVLTIKDNVLDDRICMLACFHKDSDTSCNKKEVFKKEKLQ